MDYRPNIVGDWLSGTWLHKLASLNREYLHSGEIFHFWASHLFEEILGSPDATFADLHAKVVSGEDPLLKDLVFTAVHAKNDTIQVFSYETTPDVRLVDALQASMTLPKIFQVTTVRYKDGREFGKFVDGGVRIANPINLLDKAKYTDPHYPLQSTASPHESIAINPSSIGFSLSWRYKLDPTITPISDTVKKEIEAHIEENKLATTLQSQGLSALNWLKTQKQKVTEFFQYYKYKYYKYYDLGDAARHILSFNIGLPTLQKEDRAQKLKDHYPNAIQIWNLDIPPHETEFSEKQKQRADIVGKATVYSWWDKLHHPTQVFQGHYHELASDYDPNKLESYLMEFMQELAKYDDPNLQAHGYHPEELPKNIKLAFLSAKITKILNACPLPEAELNARLQNAKTFERQKQEKVALAEQKRECYLERAIINKMMEAIKSHDNEKFKRAYHAQLGKGLLRLTKAITESGYNLLHYIILEGDATTLETALALANESIRHAKQNGKKPPFASIKELLELNCKESMMVLAQENLDPRFRAILKKYCPELKEKKVDFVLAYAQIKTSFSAMKESVESFKQKVAEVPTRLGF